MSKKIILITNFTYTTHFTPTNLLENNQYRFQKDRANHYLKLLIISPPPSFKKNSNSSTIAESSNVQHFQI